MSEGTVAALIGKLRKMHGHLSAKDKRVAVECIGALTDLALQLWNATHVEPVPRPSGRYSVRKILEASGEDVGGTDRDAAHLLEDPDGTSV